MTWIPYSPRDSVNSASQIGSGETDIRGEIYRFPYPTTFQPGDRPSSLAPVEMAWLFRGLQSKAMKKLVMGSSKPKLQALRFILETARFDIGSIFLNLGIKYFELTR